MSSPVDVTCIQIDNSCNTEQSLITDAYTINIQTRFNQNLNYPITVEVIYVGDAADPSHDQILDSADIDVKINDDGTPAITQFQLETESINLQKIKPENYFGVTAIIVNFKYQGQDFFRCGYYVYQDYVNDELLQNPPQQPQINAIHRKILADKPRVTNYQINWYPSEAEILQKQMLQQQQPVNQFDNLKADLFQKSNGIFDQLQQIPTYQPPQEVTQHYYQQQQMQQQQYSQQSQQSQQSQFSQNNQYMPQQQCQQQIFQQQNNNNFGGQQMMNQQPVQQQSVFVQNSFF